MGPKVRGLRQADSLTRTPGTRALAGQAGRAVPCDAGERVCDGEIDKRE